MTKIATMFKHKSPLFIPFMMAGFPTLETSMQSILTLVEAGADMIEIGVPFSDPVADGPVIQHAAEVALNNGMTLLNCIELVKQLRATGCEIPIILFSYFNPILSMGTDTFSQAAKDAGVDGVLIVDLPPEEGCDVYQQIVAAGLEIILLASPTTEPHRFVLYQQLQPSFIYYISRCGVTGVQNELAQTLEQEVAALRNYISNIPIAVGFGISTPEQAYTVAKFADAVVVGSFFVGLLAKSR